jgi:hypothetical protein
VVDPAPQIPNGEEPDQEVPPDEILYFRIPPLEPDDEELDVVTVDDIPPLPFSVNLASLSQPEDVIANYPEWGIVAFPAGALPKRWQSSADTVYDFRVIPKLENDNIAHADVVCFKNGKQLKKSSQIAEILKGLFRERVRSQAQLIRKPGRRAE